MALAIDIDRERIAEFCREHHIKRLALFGSVLREDFSEDSDVDVLVEFEEGQTPGLDFFRMERELAELIGFEVDLLTPGFIGEHFRDDVMQKAESIYEQE